MHIVAPEHRAQLFKHVDQAEGEQHLVEVVTVVEMLEQQFFEQQTKGHRQRRAHEDGQGEAAEHARQ